MSDEFSVVVFYDAEWHDYVRRNVSAREACEVAAKYARGPLGTSGYIQRIIITDGGDATNFEWKHGIGITFPPQAAGRR